MTIHNRKLHRLKGYDYSQNGCYFVTICTQNRKNLLCELVGNDALVVPTPIGKKVIDCWSNIEKLNENIFVDNFCLMPNHVHGIIRIENQEPVDIPQRVYGFETIENTNRSEDRQNETMGERRGQEWERRGQE